jgi:predicted protein tyrosine phosphatase
MREKAAPTPLFRWGSGRMLAITAASILTCLVGIKVYDIAVGPNFHQVERGCYRAAQPSPERLKQIVQRHDIRTVFNLRGPNAQYEWYRSEAALLREMGIDLVDVSMSAHHPLPASTLRRLIEEIDRAQERGPLLFHCWHGGDRSGLASAFYLLLQPNTTFEEASSQLSWRYGHNPWGKAKCQDDVLAEYRSWLSENKLRHTPDNFRRWADEGYRYEPQQQAAS